MVRLLRIKSYNVKKYSIHLADVTRLISSHINFRLSFHNPNKGPSPNLYPNATQI